MKLNKILFFILISLLVMSCSGGGSDSTGSSSATLTSIAVTPANPSIAKGATQQFIATGTYSDSSTKNITTSVTWSSSDTNVATIGSLSGLAASLTTGTTTITATSGSISGSTILTVTAAALVSIAVTPANPGVAGVTTQQFTATGTYSDSSTKDITTSATWSSSNMDVATIGSSTGLAATVATGTTTIQATSGSISGSTTLTVTAPTLSSIAVTPGSNTISLGATQQFTAKGTYSNSTTQDITASVTWSSSGTSVATISNVSGSRGLAASLASGSSSISASLSGVTSNTAQLTVSSTAMDNVMPITVNGSLCSSGSYPNKPCVSVTICEPGTSNCTTVSDILLDTGSYGLRVFGSLLSGISLTPVTSGTGSLTNCVQYVDGSAHWGPVEIADVVLGNETASSVPIQIINATFGTNSDQIESLCGNPDATPSSAGLNGILGVGLFKQDCGSSCVSDVNNGRYFSCDGTTCSAAKASLSDQVINPVAMLTTDNNGFILRLPDVATGGVTSADGVLILGIGTKSNNTAAGVTSTYATDSYGEFTTVYSRWSYATSFMDTGSNGLYFDSSIRQCSSGTAAGWYCPTSTQSLSATLAGYSASFKIGNASTIFNSYLYSPYYNVFSELGAPYGDNYGSFDWGLPFFLGRNVYMVIEGNTVFGLGTGPYLAY
jgi:hypothetical protein